MVDPVSLVAAAAGVATCIMQAAELFKSWRKKRKTRDGEALETALVTSPRLIQDEADSLSRQSAPRSSFGDSIALERLTRALARFNRSVTQTVRLAIRHDDLLDLSSLLNATHSIRDATLDNIRGYYQRLQATALHSHHFNRPREADRTEVQQNSDTPYALGPEVPTFRPTESVRALSTALDIIAISGRPVGAADSGAVELRAEFRGMRLPKPELSALRLDALPSAEVLRIQIANLTQVV